MEWACCGENILSYRQIFSKSFRHFTPGELPAAAFSKKSRKVLLKARKLGYFLGIFQKGEWTYSDFCKLPVSNIIRVHIG